MLAIVGALMVFVGAIWIAVIAFQNGDTVWGVVSIFCGIAALIYGVTHFDEAKAPLGVLVLGMILGAVGRGMEMGQ
jgi:hypothetical protein